MAVLSDEAELCDGFVLLLLSYHSVFSTVITNVVYPGRSIVLTSVNTDEFDSHISCMLSGEKRRHFHCSLIITVDEVNLLRVADVINIR